MKLLTPLPIFAAGRLPIGRFGGTLAGLGSVAFSTELVARLMEDPALPRPGRLHWGLARSHTQGMNPARTIAVRGGLGDAVPGATFNMACASGMAAVMSAAQILALGGAEAILAGGAEAMSDTPFLLPGFRWGYRFGHQNVPDVMHQDGLLCPLTGLLMGQTIERLATRHGIRREDADGLAAESHRRAASADFSAELVPHPALDHDECIKGATRAEDLASLPPVFEVDGQVSAGNASAIADGAAALLLGRPGVHGPAPLARILGFTEVALDPMDMGFGPVPAVQTLLRDLGMTMGDVDLWELNEAFAAQVLCCAQALDLPLDRLNVAGGGISLGHPIGCSGARILVTLIHQLRLRGGGIGVATLGVGGGLGQAMMVEVEGGR